MTVHLATGLAIIDGRVLLVASHYPNHPQPLWNLPGGRQLAGELLTETVEREALEETGLHVHAGPLAYVTESYDGAVHYVNACFHVEVVAELPETDDTVRDHVVGWEWVPLDQLGQRIVVAVVREPLLAYLRGELAERYAGFHEAGITIEWPADSQ
jgi:8-oxo-dGTP diphosphatase